jgi:hypothetical protein
VISRLATSRSVARVTCRPRMSTPSPRSRKLSFIHKGYHWNVVSTNSFCSRRFSMGTTGGFMRIIAYDGINDHMEYGYPCELTVV